MRELIEKLRAATAPSPELDAYAAATIFGGELISFDGLNLGTGATVTGAVWRCKEDDRFSHSLSLTQSIDDLNAVFDRALPGCGRISAKGRVSENEPLYGYQVFASDLSPEPLEPIGEGEHGLEAYAYLIAMLQAVEAKRGGAR